MTGWLSGLRERAEAARRAGNDALWRVRQRRRGLDHLLRAYARYQDVHGDRLAAAVTYFGFLSFFPLLALAFSVVGYLAEFDPSVRAYLDAAVRDALPGLADQLPIQDVADARVGAGIIGLVGLVVAGLGWIAALSEALHTVWLREADGGPLARLVNAPVVVVLGVAMLGSVALSGVVTSAARTVAGAVGLSGSPVTVAAVWVLGLAASVAVDTVIFLVLFWRLSGAPPRWPALWRGALIAGTGFEALKLLATLLIGGTLSNPVYASFAVLVGLLVWINIVMRFTLYAAAWTATALDVPPPYLGTLPVAGNVPEPRRDREQGGAVAGTD
ncbi:YihY/virulence factor BrkB family protein [Allonocardiopsis opalescens]|uniref:Membrane protein n=1 Tax=Allonocardiopsis opalescens TaxID=1144618 RepID=A0A2T0PSI0_9ACTN|nr:YhjD/YihY/BrkB family envelope integrity protein [Allonocardiopsis opalescens]PRX91850.1 membrane protein [Allonocardiopsis opalescens]